MKKRIVLALVSLVIAAAAWAATNSVSYSDLHNVKTVSFTFSNLNVVNHVPSAPTNDVSCVATSKVLSGSIERVTVTASSMTGSVFTITVLDADGVDVLRGAGSQISTTVGTTFCPSLMITNANGYTHRPVVFESALTATITNFASSTTTNTGTIKIYYRE